MSDMIAVELDCTSPATTQLLGKLVEDLRLSSHTVLRSMIFYDYDSAITTERPHNPDITPRQTSLPALGSSFGGGFFAGVHELNGERYAMIVAPKAYGEKLDVQFKCNDRRTSDRTNRDDDGFANSDLINDVNHPAALFCRSLDIAGHSDWYLPSRDELAMIERNLGPNRDRTPELFKSGAAQAFEGHWYWTSTEHASDPYGAWLVGFSNGCQGYSGKDFNYAVRAVRRLKI